MAAIAPFVCAADDWAVRACGLSLALLLRGRRRSLALSPLFPGFAPLAFPRPSISLLPFSRSLPRYHGGRVALLPLFMPLGGRPGCRHKRTRARAPRACSCRSVLPCPLHAFSPPLPALLSPVPLGPRRQSDSGGSAGWSQFRSSLAPELTAPLSLPLLSSRRFSVPASLPLGCAPRGRRRCPRTLTTAATVPSPSPGAGRWLDAVPLSRGCLCQHWQPASAQPAAHHLQPPGERGARPAEPRSIRSAPSASSRALLVRDRCSP